MNRMVSTYIVTMTIVCIILFYVLLRQRDLMRKNKCKYDLRKIRFEIEPLGSDTWKLNFYCGKLLHSEEVSEIELFNDKGYFYKAFVKWAEEEK